MYHSFNLKAGSFDKVEIKTGVKGKLLYSFTLARETRIWFSQGDEDLTPRIKLVTPVLPEEGELYIEPDLPVYLNFVNHSQFFSVKISYAAVIVA